jgi:hypothetical protein
VLINVFYGADLRNMKSLTVFLPKHAFLVNLHHVLQPQFI